MRNIFKRVFILIPVFFILILFSTYAEARTYKFEVNKSYNQLPYSLKQLFPSDFYYKFSILYKQLVNYTNGKTYTVYFKPNPNGGYAEDDYIVIDPGEAERNFNDATFTLAHEWGHQYFNHTYNRKHSDISLERDADIFAALFMIKNGYSLNPTIAEFKNEYDEDNDDDSHDPGYERANMLQWIKNKYGGR